MKKIFFILSTVLFLACSKSSDIKSTTSYEGKWVGNVTLSTRSTSTSYSMVVDLSSRTNANEYNFLFANRQSVAIVNGSTFTIPKVQGAPSFVVSGSGSFINPTQMSIDYTEEIQGSGYQNFKGVLNKF